MNSPSPSSLTQLQSPTSRSHKKRLAGFSLVEVIIAVGIVATVMLGLVGVMPVGLQSIQDAQHNSVKSRILQEIISDLQAAQWASAQELGNKSADSLKLQTDLLGERNVRFYNSQGARILPQQGSNSGEAPPVIIYAALAEVANNGDNPRLMTADNNNAYKFLKIIDIYVEHTPGGRRPEFKSKGRAKFVEKFPFILANMGNSASVRAE